MKKIAFLLLWVLMALPAMARDFEHTYDGQTVTYTVIDEAARTCRTKSGTSAASGNVATGRLWLPSNPSDGTTEYTLTEIGDYSFAKCADLTEVYIPSTVTDIGVQAFRGCSGLRSAVVPPSVVNMDEDAFWLCNSLEKSAYPEHLKKPFEWGISIKYPTEALVTDDGCVYSSDMTTLYFAPLRLSGDFVIPSTVTTVATMALMDCNALTKIVIPASVTTIESQAFKGCGYLSELFLEDGECQLDIYCDAFVGCFASKLYLGRSCNRVKVVNDQGGLFPNSSSLTIGTNVTIIPERAFFGCNSLTGEINIPESVTEIGECAFSECSGLTGELIIPNSVTKIGRSAFNGCSSFTSVIISESVTSIEESTFWGCSSLTSVKMPDHITSIGYFAFYECSSLTSIEIPKDVTLIEGDAFQCCDLLSYVKMNSITPPEMKFTGFGTNPVPPIPFERVHLALPEDASLPEYFSGEWIKSKEITIGSITTKRFSDKNMTYLFIKDPNNRQAIIQSVNNPSLIEYEIPERITDLTDPDDPVRYNITGIGALSFKDFKNLKAITFSPFSKVTFIGKEAFRGCKSLVSMDIAEGVKSIGDGAFSGCTVLTSVTIPNTVETIGSGAFSSCTGLTSIIIPNSVETIGKSAFYYCMDLTLVKIGSGVKTIGDMSFDHCYIDKVDFASVEGLCNIEFEGEHSDPRQELVSHQIGQDRTLYIDGKEVTELVIPNSVKAIKDRRFSYYSGLTSVTIGDSVTYIGDNAFYGCSGLTGDLIIPNLVTSIGDNTFYDCDGLTSLTIPNSVTHIGVNAFKHCGSVRYVYSLNPEAPSVNKEAFDYIGSRPLYVPEGSAESYAAAQGWSNFSEIREWRGLPDITISEPGLSVSIGDSAELSVTITEHQAVIIADSERWTSDNEAVATVENGTVKAVGAGTASITYSVEDRFGYTNRVTCKVRVLTHHRPGDANGDGVLAVNDVVLTARGVVNDIDDSLVFIAVDMNGDDRLTVGDLTKVVNAVISYSAPAKTAAGNHRRVIEAAGAASPLMLTRNGSDINVAFGNDGRFTGVQFDVTGDDGLTVTSVTLAEASTEGHSAANHRLESGALRMLAYGTENFAANGVFATIHTESIGVEPHTVTLTNVMASDFNGNLYRLPDCEVSTGNSAGIDSAAAGGMSIRAEGRTLIITSDEETTVIVNDLKGITRSLRIPVGVSRHTLPSAGIYIVNNHKFIIR